jgi:hypothetical protein
MLAAMLGIGRVRIGSEMPQTASAAGRQKYPRAHGQDRASSGLGQRIEQRPFERRSDAFLLRAPTAVGSPEPMRRISYASARRWGFALIVGGKSLMSGALLILDNPGSS